MAGLTAGLVAGAFLSLPFGASAGTVVGGGGSVLVSGAGTCDPTNASCAQVVTKTLYLDGGGINDMGFVLNVNTGTSTWNFQNGNVATSLAADIESGLFVAANVSGTTATYNPASIAETTSNTPFALNGNNSSGEVFTIQNNGVETGNIGPDGTLTIDAGLIQTLVGNIQSGGSVTASNNVSATNAVSAGTAITAGTTITATGTIKGLHYLGRTALTAANVTGTTGLTSPSITGTDVEGAITFTGASNAYVAGATLFTLTFGTGYGTAPSVMIQPANATTAALFLGNTFAVSTTGTFVATAGAAATTTAVTYKFQYLVMGQ